MTSTYQDSETAYARHKPSKTKSHHAKNIPINPNEIDHYKTFSQEIPDEFKYSGIRGAFNKLKFWDKAARDRWSWDIIPKDAERLDKVFSNRETVTEKTEKAAEKLKDDSFNYIDKHKSYAKAEDKYTNKDSTAKVIITKRTLIAKKMINKVVSEVENSGDFSNDGSIKEGAQNVTLNSGIEINMDPKDVNSSSNLKWKDCRKRKLFEHDPEPKDCRQESIGDCWLQSGLIDILTKKGPKPIKDMFKDEGASGYVQIKLYYPKNRNGYDMQKSNWIPKYYRIPKRIPVRKKDGIPIYNSGALWVHYLEAAVAKSNIRNKALNQDRTKKEQSPSGNTKIRDYSSIIGGFSEYVWHMVFGNNVNYKHYINKKSTKKMNTKISEKVDELMQDPSNYAKLPEDQRREKIQRKVRHKYIKKEKYGIYQDITDAVNNQKLIKLSFNKFAKSDEKGTSAGEPMSRGLAANHAYSVCGYEEENGIKYLRLINPWSSRIGCMYNEHNKKVEKYSFEGKGDESFRVKYSTIFKYIKSLTIEQDI